MHKRLFHALYVLTCWVIVLPILCLTAICAKIYRSVRSIFVKIKKPKLIWCGAPMHSLSAASDALSVGGYDSFSVATHRTSNNLSGQFDVMLITEQRLWFGLNTVAYIVRCVSLMVSSMFTRDIVHCFFSGGILGHTPLASVEVSLWKFVGCKVIVFPYGTDGFVYAELPDAPWAKALKETYPRSRRVDMKFKRGIKRMSKQADCVIGCMVHTVNLPRVDVWPVLWYPAGKMEASVGLLRSDKTFRVVHPSNHRAIKGTNSLIAAVDNLQRKGLDISLDVIENVTIEESRKRVAKSDVVVDQLLMGYAMTALEGLTSGKIVISGYDNSEIYAPFYKNSYLKECPIIQGSPETIEDVLFNLYMDSAAQENIKQSSLAYIEKRHSNEACVDLFEAIYAKIYWKKNVNLLNLYK